MKFVRSVRKRSPCVLASAAENRCETQNCRHFWTRFGSPRLESVNSHGDRGGPGREPQTVVTFGLVSDLRVSKVSTVTGIRGVLVANRRIVVTFGLGSRFCVFRGCRLGAFKFNVLRFRGEEVRSVRACLLLREYIWYQHNYL